MNNCLVYDFETLGTRPDAVVLALAILPFDSEKMLSDNPYTFSELVSDCVVQKYDAKEQLEKFGRSIEKETLDWWEMQPKEAQKILEPDTNRDVSITTLPDFFVTTAKTIPSIKYVYSRGTLDPIILDSIVHLVGTQQAVYPHYCWRDTRSWIDAWLELMGESAHSIKNTFIPQDLDIDFIKHDPAHDISVDVMRIQTIIRAIVLD